MFTPLCKRCMNLCYYKYIFKLVNDKGFNTATNKFYHNVHRYVSNRATNLDYNRHWGSVNLTYEKVESKLDDGVEDEYLYPEALEGVSSVSLDKLISFRNAINSGDTVVNDEADSLSGLISQNVSDVDLKIRNSEITQYLERVLREKVNPKCKIYLFGSAINGLWTDWSDLDVCVEIPNVNSRSGVIRNLRRISSVLAPLSPTRVIQNRFTAKIPILNWKRDPQKKLITPVDSRVDKYDGYDFEYENIDSIDVSVNNTLAVANSILVGSYVSFEPRLRNMILYLKTWAKSKNLNDRSRGTLSSFAISLMVIHYLQNCSPPILPSLQDLAFLTNEPANYIGGVDCRFTTDNDKIKAELEYLSKGKANTMDDRALLMNFFRYYGWYNLHAQNKPILIRSVDLSELDNIKGDNGTDGCDNVDKSLINEPYLHVDNPFEIGVDVANISNHQRSRITSELRRAYQSLKSGNSLTSLLTGIYLVSSEDEVEDSKVVDATITSPSTITGSVSTAGYGTSGGDGNEIKIGVA